jgi:exosortase
MALFGKISFCLLTQKMDEEHNLNQNQQTVHINPALRLIILTVLVLGLGFTLYQDTIVSLFESTVHREYSSHGLFVPLLSAHLLWLKRHEIRRVSFQFSFILGATILTVAFIMLHIVKDSQDVALPALSFVVAASGLTVGLFGLNLFRKLFSPLLFLLTMIPLPNGLYVEITDCIRAVSTDASTQIAALAGIPIYRQGFHIHLPDHNLFVGIECSGSRYLLSYFTFGLYYALLCKKTTLSRVLVLLASFPLALFANILRLSLIYLLVFRFGNLFLNSRPHLLLGWLVFACGLVFAIWLDQLIAGFKRRHCELTNFKKRKKNMNKHNLAIKLP